MIGNYIIKNRDWFWRFWRMLVYFILINFVYIYFMIFILEVFVMKCDFWIFLKKIKKLMSGFLVIKVV